jgi:hypothetical protein
MVTGDGQVAALRPGSVILTATCEGVRASVRIGVAAEPAATTLEPNLRPPPRRRSRRGRRRALLAGGGLIAAGVLWLVLRPAPPGHGAAVSRVISPAAGYTVPAAGVDTVPAPTVIIESAPTRSLRPEATMRLTARVRDPADRPMRDAVVVWSSTDSTVVRIDRETGRLVALSPGRAQVVAASGTGRDSAVISVRRPGVRPPAAAAVAIDRSAIRSVRAGDSTQLRAVALGPRGDTLTGAEITWVSSTPQVATIDALSGVVRGRAPGTALILATSGNQSSLAELTVLPTALASLNILGARPMAVEESLVLRVVARDPSGEDVVGIPVAWSSSDSTVALVDPASGTVVGVAPGSVTITASAEDVSARTRLTVLTRPARLPGQGGADPDRAADWMATGVEGCYGAVQSHNLFRLQAIWQPQNQNDQENLRQLSRILGTSDLSATVGERVERPPAIGPEAATMDFTVPLTWQDPPRAAHNAMLVFRAEFVRAAGRWEMSSCRIVGAPKF